MEALLETMSNIIPAEIEPYSSEFIWIVVVGFILGFIVAMSVGGKRSSTFRKSHHLTASSSF